MEPKDETEMLPSHVRTLTNEKLLLMNEQRKWLEMKSIPDEDAVKTVEKDLEYYITLADKAVAEFERIPILKQVLLWVKCSQAALHATEKSLMRRRVNGCGKFHHCLSLSNCHKRPSITPMRGKTLYQQKDNNILKAQIMPSNEIIFN